MNWLPIEECPKDGKRYFLASRVYWGNTLAFLWNFYVGYYKEYRRPKNGEAGRWLVYGTNRKINPKYYQLITNPTETKQ